MPRPLVDHAPLADRLAGIAAPVAKTLVGVVADLAMAEQDAVPPAWDQEAVEQHMRRELGDKAYEGTVRAANATVRRMGPDFAAWLGESGWGNVPAMIHALAALGPDGLLTKNTPDHARQAMKQIRANKDHAVNKPGAKGRGAALVQWKLLSALASMETEHVKDGGKSELATRQRGQRALDAIRHPEKPSTETLKLEAEKQAIYANPDYYKSGPTQKALSARLRQIFSSLYPE